MKDTSIRIWERRFLNRNGECSLEITDERRNLKENAADSHNKVLDNGMIVSQHHLYAEQH